MVTFTGRCRTHRAAVLMLRGDWDAAVAEANHACESFAGAADEAAAGEAFYLLAELYRLAGRDTLAEQAYRQAGEWGRDPQPGLALLRLAQGRAEAAAATVNRLLGEQDLAIDRVRMLPAAVAVLLEVGDVTAAAVAAEELAGLAGSFDTPGLQAAAAHAEGAVLLARDYPAEALARLRDATRTWRSVNAVFELARTRVLIAEACRRLGDDDTADVELAAARRTLTDLGAGPALAALPSHARDRYGLSARELEVLRLVATGLTNREVAERLTIAVRTVDRHVASILTKLGVPSRTAAGWLAHERGLI
jgi:DNA-binding CsgD family transcriptional regulator